MARIRTVKPEIWTDESFGEVSVSARLLFIGALNFADDYGGLDRSSKQLKAQVFPYDSIDCEPLVLELIRVGLFVEYEVDERKYLHIKGFSLHQKVENKGKPRIPIYQSSPNPHREVTEVSPETQPLREGKGREKKRHAAHAASASPPLAEPPPDLDLDAWARWLEYRKGIKKPIKPPSVAAAQRDMAALGPRQAEAVEYTVAKGWTGLRAPDKPKAERAENGLPTLRLS